MAFNGSYIHILLMKNSLSVSVYKLKTNYMLLINPLDYE